VTRRRILRLHDDVEISRIGKVSAVNERVLPGIPPTPRAFVGYLEGFSAAFRIGNRGFSQEVSPSIG